MEPPRSERDRARDLASLRRWEEAHDPGREPPPFGWDPWRAPPRHQGRLRQRRLGESGHSPRPPAWELVGAVVWVVLAALAFWAFI
jgi:hypothetical protein